MKQLSIVVPCYNEASALPYFLEEIRKVTDIMSVTYDLSIELLFVDDGSSDQTLELLRVYAKADSRVKYLSFSRNFGKEAAMYAGLRHALGDYVAVMDADMQDPPMLLPQMYQEIQSGTCDSVATRRVNRKGEPPIRSFFARLFYKIINRISDTEIVDGARDFRLMTRKMVDAIIDMGEYNRFSKGIFGWVGFRTKWLPYENIERVAGKSKWSFWRLFQYSIQGILAFSTVPLALASIAGVVLCFAAFVMILYIVVWTLRFGNPVSGWSSMVCIIMFLGGIQLFCMGILGQYLAKTYLEAKKRPIYIIAETQKDTPANSSAPGQALEKTPPAVSPQATVSCQKGAGFSNEI